MTPPTRRALPSRGEPHYDAPVVRLGRWRLLLFVGGLSASAPSCTGDDTVGVDRPDPFAPSVAWPTGLPARALAVVDGASSDVALAFQLDNRVGLLDVADGDLLPTAAQVGVSPIAICALDVDGDGSLELATANAGDATLCLLGRADTGLAHLATAELALRPKHVCSADLDQDGRDEAIVTVGLQGEADQGIEVWRHGAAGLELVGPRWTVEDAFAATTGDVDGDGDLDVIAVLTAVDEVAWATNDGRGHLSEAGRASVCTAPRAAAMADDGIAVACRDGLALVHGDVVSRVPVEGNLYDLAAGDFDSDGRTDLAAVDLTHDSVLVFFARADGGWSPPTKHPVGGDPVALAAADLGGDDDLDLVVSAFATRTVDVLENRLVRQERNSP